MFAVHSQFRNPDYARVAFLLAQTKQALYDAILLAHNSAITHCFRR
jgi:hypothetical protein